MRIFASTHFAAASFPVYLHFWGWTIHPHAFFETLSYLAGFQLYLALRRRQGDTVPTPLRWAVVAAAVAGAALGSKLLSWMENPQLTLTHWHDPATLLGGKTIVGGLIGGLIAVEAMKRAIGMRQSTGDLYAIPLAVGIAIGRVGCFLTGLADNTCGTPTWLPWGVDFGDAIPRHPAQIYEILFCLGLIPLLMWFTRRVQAQSPGLHPGDVFKMFMVCYLTWRLLVDFLKPYPAVALGLGSIQWACLIVLCYYAKDLQRWAGHHPAPAAAKL